jgi:hypothetical protein
MLMAKMQSLKFEVEKFCSKRNFELWKLKMRDLLVQQGLKKHWHASQRNQQP